MTDLIQEVDSLAKLCEEKYKQVAERDALLKEKDAALRLIMDDQHMEENRYVFITAKDALSKTFPSEALERALAVEREKFAADTETERVLIDVSNERLRQHSKWDGVFSDDAYTPLDWHEMIADYNGWARRMACMGSEDKARTRYVQIAALAAAAVEALDRRSMK